jgi:hypothetical protein
MIMETLEKYIGKTIESFKFSSGELNFGFTDGDKLSLRAEGDCCSNSWFEEIFGDEALVKGAGLLELRLIELPETEARTIMSLLGFTGSSSKQLLVMLKLT